MLKNRKGFTLIELLAVIVILGVLMMTAIPAMSGYIENAKKDVFVDDAKSFINDVRYGMLNDNYLCGGLTSSGISAGTWYIPVDSSKLEKGGKSPWGGTAISGYVRVIVSADGKYKYSIFIYDQNYKHGIGTRTGSTLSGDLAFIDEDSLVRGTVLTGTAAYKSSSVINTTNTCASSS